MITASPGDTLRALCRSQGAQVHVAEAQWTELLRLATVHAVTPTVAIAARSRVPDMPRRAAERLDERRRRIAARNLLQVERLVALRRTFERAGLVMVPIKGPVLAATAYGDVAMREFVDLDVLVRPTDVAAAVALLRPGRVMEPAIPAPLLQQHVRADHELTFRDGDGEIELQWQVVPRFFVANIDIDGMIARSVPVDVAGAELRSLTTEDSVLLLSVHASKHLWERFAWVVDLDRVATGERPPDWRTVRDRAAEAGVLRMVRLGVAIADRGLSPSWVGSAREGLGPDGAVESIADRLAAGWFRPGERAARTHADPNFQPELFRLHDRSSDRFRHVWRWLVTPTDEDVTTVTLPRWGRGGYRLVRVVRLAGRTVRRS